MTFDAFLGKAVAEMIEDKISIKFINRKNESKHQDSSFSAPPFSDFTINYWHKKSNSEDWKCDFIHEYCHYLQWKLENDKWGQPYENAYTTFNDYFNNKDRKCISPSVIEKVVEVEVDCGLKVAKLLRRKRIKFDTKRYFKYNNLYILCYSAMVKYKTFNIPYEFTNNIMKCIPVKPLTMESWRNFKHYDKIDFCYKLAYTEA